MSAGTFKLAAAWNGSARLEDAFNGVFLLPALFVVCLYIPAQLFLSEVFSYDWGKVALGMLILPLPWFVLAEICVVRCKGNARKPGRGGLAITTVNLFGLAYVGVTITSWAAMAKI